MFCFVEEMALADGGSFELLTLSDNGKVEFLSVSAA